MTQAHDSNAPAASAWIGVLLWQASERVSRAQLTRDPAQLVEYLGKVRTLTISG
jgi:hypothetical protein